MEEGKLDQLLSLLRFKSNCASELPLFFQSSQCKDSSSLQLSMALSQNQAYNLSRKAQM